MTALSETRAELRTRLRREREALRPVERIAAAQGLVEQLEQLPEFLVDQRVGGYWAVGGEMSLHVAVARLRRREQHYYLPAIGTDHSMRYAPYRADTAVEPNRYGIPEPVVPPGRQLDAAQLELVFVPLLGFDRRGGRLGHGAGYYDRAFEFLGKRPRPSVPLLVGIGYAFQEVDALPVEAWDVPLDYVATERELIDCTAIPQGTA